MDRFLRPVAVSQQPSLVLRAGVAVVTLGIALTLSFLFLLFFGSGTFLLFFGAVAIIAAYSGLRIGLLSVVVSLILLTYFSFPPFNTSALTPDVVARAFIFIFVAGLIGWLSDARRASEREREEVLSRSRALQQRTALLAELGIAMTSSLDYMTTLQQLARTVVPFLADFCIVYIQQPNGVIERVVVVHRDPKIEALLHGIKERDTIDPLGPNPVAKVLRTGKPDVVFALAPDAAQARASSDEQQRAVEFLRPQAYIVIPLSTRGHTLGAINFTMTEAGRPYTEDDVALAEEIARRVALAIDNAQLYQQAQNALRLREQFLSIAAHELKTPLTTLTGQVQLLQRRAERDGEVSERGQRSLAIIDKQLRRLNKMVTALLDISRIENGQLSIEPTPFDICELVHRVVSEMQETVENRQIEAVSPDVPLIVVGDVVRLEQVLHNLIQNALNYSQPPAPTTVTVRQEGEQVAIAVQDRGIGIPAVALPHLFTRFYRGENAGERYTGGMGIGLSVAKEIVTLHNGDVQVESVEGVGSTFTIRLPLKVEVETADA